MSGASIEPYTVLLIQTLIFPHSLSLSLANMATRMNVPSVLIFDKDSFFLVVFFIKICGCSLFFVNLS
ncbi:hypothetical protein HanXRQr2_Chr01g0011341 [Helianthus annuus]|uniref:Uncharacterized protein n=1 Tax=Helianthus annuus TaxID=4232 RepID=A0A251V3H9_HELAN|nr:hypothetical protein HanXRQr2_Chr01g0011341 [Helianthus annuus]